MTLLQKFSVIISIRYYHEIWGDQRSNVNSHVDQKKEKL